MLQSQIPGLTVFAFFISSSLGAFDQIYLRDGTVLEGRVLTEQRGTYTVQSDAVGSAHLHLPKAAVKYVLYADADKAEQYLELRAARRLCPNPELLAVDVLPTEAFGQAAVAAVQKASESIWILAYLVSGSQTSPIKEFYQTIREKARSGIDVVMICEYSTATTPGVRHTTMNFVQDLAKDQITVRFVQEFKSMHKKMIIVDRKTILLGSSNLTLAGTSHSNEMNVRINSESFVRAAVEDFRRMQARSLLANEVN